MIKECAQKIVEAVRVGFPDIKTCSVSAGGNEIDPYMLNVKAPAAWVVFTGDFNAEGSAIGSEQTTLDYSFSVIAIVDYGTQQQAFDAFDHMQAIRTAVRGVKMRRTVSIKYVGQSLVNIEGKRMVYSQQYSLRMPS